MKLVLGWWRNVEWGQYEEMKSLILEILVSLKAKQVLHIPFARTWIRKLSRDSFSPCNFNKIISESWWAGLIYILFIL